VVEDEPELRSILREILEADGYRVLTAEDGTEAAQMLDGSIKHIDILLSDVTLPGMGGYDLVEKARGLRADLPIILMSGYLSHEKPGFTVPKDIDLLAKPFHFSDLLLKIHGLLSPAGEMS
jgi:DNA-binding response OmpR family regulator